MDKKSSLLESLRQKEFSEEIIKSFSEVKREDFIFNEFKESAYEDTSLPIGYGQTISQPYTIAVMLTLLDLKKGQKVLEVGSGCGYAIALISKIIGESGKAFGIEIIKELAEMSVKNLKRYKNVFMQNKNGSLGLEEEAPFDRILISASCKKIPENLALQLKEGGIMVVPINFGGDSHSIISFKKIKNKIKKIREIKGFLFVPFIEKNIKSTANAD